MAIWHYRVDVESLGYFYAAAMTARENSENHQSGFENDGWMLLFDLWRAQRLYPGDDRAVCEYLRPGREDWGPDKR